MKLLIRTAIGETEAPAAEDAFGHVPLATVVKGPGNSSPAALPADEDNFIQDPQATMAAEDPATPGAWEQVRATQDAQVRRRIEAEWDAQAATFLRDQAARLQESVVARKAEVRATEVAGAPRAEIRAWELRGALRTARARAGTAVWAASSAARLARGEGNSGKDSPRTNMLAAPNVDDDSFIHQPLTAAADSGISGPGNNLLTAPNVDEGTFINDPLNPGADSSNVGGGRAAALPGTAEANSRPAARLS